MFCSTMTTGGAITMAVGRAPFYKKNRKLGIWALFDILYLLQLGTIRSVGVDVDAVPI